MKQGHLARFTDDLYPAGNIPPQTYGGLLTELDVFGKPEYIQKRRVKRWLKHNEPSTNLSFFLNYAGYDVELPRSKYEQNTADPVPETDE